MFKIQFTVSVSQTSLRGHGKLMRSLNRGVMELVRDVYWPQHYRINAKTRPGGEYGYSKRGMGYMLYKAKRWGHQDPLVFSGRTRDTVRESAANGITATQYRSKLRAKTAFPTKAQLRKELEVIAPSEKRSMMAWSQREYVRRASSGEFGRRYKRRIQG